MTSHNKIGNLSDIQNFIKEGSSVAIGGAWLCNHPMAIVREIIRLKIKNLKITTIVGSIDIDMLLGSKAIKRLMFSFVSMEAFGLAPNFRRAIEKEGLEYDEITGLAIILGLEATGRGVPFLPYRGPFGSDCVKVRPEFYKTLSCPFTGEELIGVRAIKPDIGVIHAQRADEMGNVQIEGTSGSDLDIAKASDKVIVTVEEIVSTEEIRKTPEKTKIPRFYVDLVIKAPMGAHPTSCIPYYVSDPWHMMEYMQLASKPETFGEYIDKFVIKSEADYLEAIGGSKKVNTLKQLAKEVKQL